MAMLWHWAARCVLAVVVVCCGGVASAGPRDAPGAARSSAAVDEVLKARLLEQIERTLPKRGSVFLEFQSDVTGGLVFHGYDFATGAGFVLLPRVTSADYIGRVKQADGKVFRFEGTGAARRSEMEENTPSIMSSPSFAPFVVLHRLLSVPQAITHVSSDGESTLLEFDLGVVSGTNQPESTDGAGGTESSSPMIIGFLLDGSLRLASYKPIGRNWQEIDAAEGLPPGVTVPKVVRERVRLVRAEFVPEGDASRFEIDKVRAIPPASGPGQAPKRAAPSLTQAARGVDASGRPIVLGDPGLTERAPSSSSAWMWVLGAGVALIAAGGWVWWRRR